MNDKSSVIESECLPQMKLNETQDYSITFVISDKREVIQSLCDCPSGKGYTKGGKRIRCKHVFALFID